MKKKRIPSETARLLVFTELRTDAKAATTSEHNFCSFWRSDLEENQFALCSAVAFWLRTRVGVSPVASTKVK